MSGFNVTVFAYGQTSSGKTHTMRGYEGCMGLIPLSIREIFKRIEEDSGSEYAVSVSYMEVLISHLTLCVDLQRECE